MPSFRRSRFAARSFARPRFTMRGLFRSKPRFAMRRRLLSFATRRYR